MSDTNDLDAPLESTQEPEELLAATIFPEQSIDSSKEPMPDFAGNYLPLKEFYGINDLDQESQTKLQAVWEHFIGDSKTPSTVLKKIRMQHINMVEPPIGQTKLEQMYNYVRLAESAREANEMLKVYKNDS